MKGSAEHIVTPAFAVAFALKFFSSTVFSLLNTALVGYAIAAYGSGATEAGFVVGVFTIGSMCIRPLAGRIVGRFGAGRLLVLGCMAFAIMTAVCAAPTGYIGLVLSRLLQGMAFGIIHNTVTVVVAEILPANDLGHGMGLFAISTTLSSAVGPFLGISLQQSGADGGLFATAIGATVAAAVLSLVLLKMAPGLSRRYSTASTHHGTIHDYIEVGVLGISAASLLVCMGYAGVSAFLSSFLTSRGLGDFAPYYFLVYPVVLVVLRPLLGRLIDRGYGRVIVIGTLGAFGGGLLLLSAAATVPTLFLSAVLIIFGYGGSFFTLQTMAIKTVQADRVGVAAATFGVLSDVGLAAGPIVMGAMQSALGYSAMYSGCAAAMAVAAIVFGIVRNSRSRTETANEG